MCGGGMAGGIFSFLVATDDAAASARINKGKKELQQAKNTRSAAETSLARFSQSLANKKLMEGAGKRFNALRENLARRQDTYTYGGIQAQLALSEELGAATAAASAAGMGGSSVEQYNATINTAYALQNELRERAQESEVYVSQQEIADVIPNAIASFSRNVYAADIDTSYVGPTSYSPLKDLAALGVAVAASAAGAPQVGEAILKGRTAGLQRQSGQGAAADASLQGALTAFKGGVGEIRDAFRFKPGSAGSASTELWGGASGGALNPNWRSMGGPYAGERYGITFR